MPEDLFMLLISTTRNVEPLYRIYIMGVNLTSQHVIAQHKDLFQVIFWDRALITDCKTHVVFNLTQALLVTSLISSNDCQMLFLCL